MSNVNNADDADEELSIAQPSDFMVSRDDEDNLQPVTQPLPGVEEHIKVVPLTIGKVEKYGLEDGMDLSDEEVAELINEHWYTLKQSDKELEPGNVDEQLVAFGKDAIIQAILNASGYSLKEAQAMEQFEQMANLPEEKFERVLELMDRQEE